MEVVDERLAPGSPFFWSPQQPWLLPAWNSSDALVAAATTSFRFCFAFRLSGDAAVEQTPPVAVTTVSD